MSHRPRKIKISSIVTDPRYYPRVEVDRGRVKEFVELMECETHFPPIKVVRDPKTGRYILLDGKHRLEAYILRGEIEIFAYVLYIPEEHWLMSSARFNSMSSKPLTGNETKNIIIITWNNGIKDTLLIANKMGCTSRYVEMVLKPARDGERLKRKKKISELIDKGISQREIAGKLGLSESYVSKVVKRYEDADKKPLLESDSEFSRLVSVSKNVDEDFPKRSNFVLESLSIDRDINRLDNALDQSDQNFSNELSTTPQEQIIDGEVDCNQTPDENIFQSSNDFIEGAKNFPKRSNFVLESQNKDNYINGLESTSEQSVKNFQSEIPANSSEIEPEKPPAENANQVFTKRNNFVLETPAENNEIRNLELTSEESPPDSEKTPPETSPPEENPAGNENQTEEPSTPPNSSPYPSYMDQIDLYNELTPQGQHAIRAMELAKKYKVDITYIAQEIGEPLPWTKKVLVSAIALSLMNGDKLNDVSNVETAIGIDFFIAEAIQAMLPFHNMLCPVAPEMEQWIKDNLSSQDLDVILELVDVKKKDLPYLLKGEKPPEPKRNCFEQLPDAYKKQLQAYITVLREIRDHAKNKRFNQDSAKQLMVHLNKNVTVINEIFDGLREDRLV